MRRVRLVVALGAVLAVALAGVALAATVKVTGGSTKLTLNDAAAAALSSNHITLTAVAPATGSGNTFTFPITGGRLNTTTLNGVLHHSGALDVSNGTKTVRVRALTLVKAQRTSATLYGAIRRSERVRCHVAGPRHHRLHCTIRTRDHVVRLARITNITVTGTTATGNVLLTGDSAALINRLAGKKIAQAGVQIGTGTTTVTVG